MDYDIINICASSKDNYWKYRKYIKPYTIHRETHIILDDMGEYYKAFPLELLVNWEAFISYSLAKNAFRLGEDSIIKLKMALDKASKHVPTMAHETVLKSFIELDYVSRIIEECEKVKEGSSDLEHVHILTSSGLKDVERYIETEDLFVAPDITSIASSITSSGYEWRLPCLNRSLGPLRKGNFVIVAARVEVGKTTFLASEASYIAQQLPKNKAVIWVNNEEESSAVFFRIVQATLGKDTKWLVDNHEEAMEQYKKAMGGDIHRIRVTKDTNQVKDLEVLFKEVDPGLIIFDQLDKVEGFRTEDREDILLGKIYRWARELSRTYGPVISASQLSASAVDYKDPPFIGMEALRGSKTDKPGEADAVITIGKFKEPKTPEEEAMRTINVPKNKLPGGGVHQLESERHGQYIVNINATHARYE